MKTNCSDHSNVAAKKQNYEVVTQFYGMINPQIFLHQCLAGTGLVKGDANISDQILKD